VTTADIVELKQQGDKNIVIYGSLSVIGTLAQQNLVDEYQLLVHPIFAGSGKPLFKHGGKAINLELVSAKTFTSGVVLLKYRPAQ